MMISSWSVACLLISLGVAHSWFLPSFFGNGNLLDGFARFNELNGQVQQLAHGIAGTTSSSIFSAEDREKLDDITPNCTTTSDSASSSREAKPSTDLVDVQTTTCVKELIIDGYRYISTETNVKDLNGGFSSQSQSYRMLPLGTLKNQTSLSP